MQQAATRDKRTGGGQPPNTAGGNTTRGETAHWETPPANRALGQRHGRVPVVESEPRALATPRPLQLQRAGVRHSALQEGGKAVAVLGEGAVAEQVGKPNKEALFHHSIVDEQLRCPPPKKHKKKPTLAVNRSDQLRCSKG